MTSGEPSASSVPLRESSRKRTPKTMGPDFVDYSTGSYRIKTEDKKVSLSKSTAILEKAQPKKLTRSLSSGSDSVGKTSKKLTSILTRAIGKREPTIAVPPVVETKRPAVKPDGCLECLKMGLEEEAYAGQHLMIHCSQLGCHYAVHKECSPYPPLADTSKFVCMDCSKCEACQEDGLHVDVDLMCRRCYKPYHKICSGQDSKKASRAGSPASLSSEDVRKIWTCPTCVTSRKRLKRKKHRRAEVKTSPLGNSKHEDSQAADASLEKITQRKRKRSDDVSAKVADLADEIIPEPKAGSLWRMELARKAVRGVIPLPLNDVQEEKRTRCLEEDRELRQDMVLWSVDQCASFFQDSNPQLAQLITKHELMGSALVLISRTQFLDLFGLPIGTALNLHAEVCRTRRLFF